MKSALLVPKKKSCLTTLGDNSEAENVEPQRQNKRGKYF